MSGPFGSSQWMYNSGGEFYPYEIEQSVRFYGGSPYFSRTFGSGGDRRTWTYSYWIKRSGLNSTQMSGMWSGETWFGRFSTGNNIVSNMTNSTSVNYFLDSKAKFRDTAAWYHIVYAVDTTQSTASNRVKLYVNGVQEEFSNSNYPPQNYQTDLNVATGHRFGSENNRYYFDGYMAEVNFVDGQQLSPTDFGEYKSDIWIPKEYSGSYGTTGFYLDFADSANFGDDESGNTNDWTKSSGIDTHDLMLDSPTNNFPTMNRNQYLWYDNLEDGNLQVEGISSVTSPYASSYTATMGVPSGKWYWEYYVVTHTNGNIAGMSRDGLMARDGSDIRDAATDRLCAVNNYDNLVYVGNSTISKTANVNASVGDIIGFAYDADGGSFSMYKNGTLVETFGTAPLSLTNGEHAVPFHSAAFYSNRFHHNFGQNSTFGGRTSAGGNSDANGFGDFKYAPPSGYLAICSRNLPELPIDNANDESAQDYFNTVLDTGTGSAKSVTGVGFKPDWVWRKARSNAQNHTLYDAVRGVHKILQSNTNNAEDTNANSLTSFDSDGFSLGTAYPNDNNYTYASWCWLAGNGTSSNTDGSVTTTASVNPKAGFSILTYTEPSGSSSYGHGLDEKPELIIIKRRDSAEGWITWHKQFAPPTNKALYLNENYAQGASGSNWMTAVSDSTFTYTSGQYTSAGSKVAYCFHSVDGYSKIGTYWGNSNSDGTFVYCGFRPAFVLQKRYDGSDDWSIHDNKRTDHGEDSNPLENYLLANHTYAEADDGPSVDFLSNGFKWRINSGLRNNSSSEYIFVAFAEQPLKYSNAR